MQSKKKYRIDSEPKFKHHVVSNSVSTPSTYKHKKVPVEISRKAQELQESITSISKDAKEQIISEIDLDSASDRHTESSKEQLKSSINSLTGQIKHIKVKQKNEKNFKDLNKSLANLASRRVLGRSSSDNDAIMYINTESAKQSQFYFEFQPTQPNSPQVLIETPSLHSKQSKNFFTSMKKGHEVTPASYYDRKNGRHNSNMDKYKKELGLSDLDYGKFKKGGHYKGPHHQSQAMTIRPIKTESESYRRHNSEWEEQLTARFYRPEYGGKIETPHNRDYEDVGSYYENETFNQRMKGIKFHLDSDVKHQIIENPYPEEESKESKESTSIYTPSFKSIMKFQGVKDYKNKGRTDSAKITRYDTAGPFYNKEEYERHDTVPENDHYERLQLNSINDGVEYSMGGLGVRGTSDKKYPHTSRGNSGEDFGFVSSRKFGKERMSGVQRETLDSWRNDIIRIKQDIQSRQIGYEELNRFTRMLEDDSPRGSKITYLNSLNAGESYGGYSDKSENHINISKIERNDYTTSNTPTLGSPSQALITQNEKGRPHKEKRISFEYRTTDADGEIHKSPLETKGDAKPKAKEFYSEYTHETNHDLNTSYAHHGVTMVERNQVTEKASCCSSSTINCNIF